MEKNKPAEPSGVVVAEIQLEDNVLAEMIDLGNLEEIKSIVPDLPGVVPEVVESEEKKGGEPDIRQILQKASLAQKVKLALFGNATCRLLLVRESNKLISLGVLKNPRLQVSEVEEFAKNHNIPEAVLRAIGNDTRWIKHVTVKRALVFNPKCPLDVSLVLAKFLTPADLKLMARSKNISQGLVGYARKRLEHLEKH